MKRCVNDLRRHGFGVLRDVLPKSDVGLLRDSIAATVRRHSTTALPQQYMGGLLARNQDIAPFLGDPSIAGICAEFFGPHTRISSISGVVSEPGVKRADLHRDWPHKAADETCLAGQFGDALVHLVTFWMLTDFTSENGGTFVKPASHRLTCGEDMPTHIQDAQILGRAGDVGLLDARTWHAVAPNLSDQARVAVIVRYAPWWLNLNPLRRGSRDRELIVDRLGGADPYVVPLTAAQFNTLPKEIQPLLYSAVE